MNTWIELEPTYLTNQPAIWVGRGKARKRVGDPDVQPTEAWLFTQQCRQMKRGVRRKKAIVTLKGKDGKDLERQIEKFCMRSDVRITDSAGASPYG